MNQSQNISTFLVLLHHHSMKKACQVLKFWRSADRVNDHARAIKIDGTVLVDARLLVKSGRFEIAQTVMQFVERNVSVRARSRCGYLIYSIRFFRYFVLLFKILINFECKVE